MPADPITLPPSLTEQYVVAGIVVFLVILAALAFWAVFRNQQNWYSQQSEIGRKWQESQQEKLLEWQQKENRAFFETLSEIVKTTDCLAENVSKLSERIEVGFAKVEERISSHDEKSDLRTRPITRPRS
jgi:predicted Holliday junction resolvase-like endonuclease